MVNDGEYSLQVCATVTGNVNTQHETNGESPVDTLPVSETITTRSACHAFAKGYLGQTSVSFKRVRSGSTEHG